MVLPISCHVIFTEETDREDWLQRCIASLEHPVVEIIVHRFAKADEAATPRRVRIHNEFVSQHPNRWVMFADPDDYAINSGYENFIAHLLTFEGSVTHPMELWEPRKVKCRRAHHLVAVRGKKVPDPLHGTFNFYFDKESVLYSELAYVWVEHDNNTRGGKKCQV